jgi:maleate isomerase
MTIDPIHAGAARSTSWEIFEAGYGKEVGWRASLGLIALATDRVGPVDFEDYVADIAGVATFTTRVPFPPVATPQTLAELGRHIEAAARLLVPGSRLDVVGLSCTSGTVAVGLERVRAAIQAGAARATAWEIFEAKYGKEVGWRASLGLIALATDRVGPVDFEDYVADIAGVATFMTRVPFPPVATPQTLAELGGHIEAAARLLVPGSRLDAIGLSCTSGTVAVGLERVRAAIQAARPGIPVTTPIDAGLAALRALGCRRISILAPYLIATADLIAGYFEANGIEVLRKATCVLDGDPQMNRVSGECLTEAGQRFIDPAADALFISCTGLRTRGMVETLERSLGKPVVTSNQALAWASLRAGGVRDALPDRGILFRTS